MGFVQVFGPCVVCKRPFFFHPHKVPSARLDGGPREPICETCVDAINVRRAARGLPPIVPLPGAYEACDESEFVTDEDY